jgi:hypothetical protein
MPYGVVTSLSAPIEVYDKIHTQVIGEAAFAIEGLLLHIGRPSSSGFEAIEVWESRDHYDRYQRELMASFADNSGAGVPPIPVPTVEEFEVRGLVVPQGNIFL